MAIIIGIDPGLSGAIAWMDLGANKIEIVDMPILELKSGKKKKKVYDLHKTVSILEKFKDNKINPCVGIEKVHSMPKQGVASSFSFGEGFGMLQGIVATLKYSLTLITPQSWKKELLKGQKKEKDASVYRAKQLFPQIADKLTTERGRKLHDRADAILIAEYLKRQLIGGGDNT